MAAAHGMDRRPVTESLTANDGGVSNTVEVAASGQGQGLREVAHDVDSHEC